MKSTRTLLVTLALTLATAACDGPVGPQGDRGPQGEQGPQGPAGQDGQDGTDGQDGQQGPQGPAGEDGNANVTLYEFGEHTFTDLLSLELSVSQETVDNSLVLVYYNPFNASSTAWYPVPGLGSNNNYQTRSYIYQTSTDPSVYTLAIRTLQPDGSGPYVSPVTFTKIRVIFAEASTILSGSLRAADVDLNDYDAVMDHYDLTEDDIVRM